MYSPSNAQIERHGSKIWVTIVLPPSSERGPVFRIKPMKLYFMEMGKVLSVLKHEFTNSDKLGCTGFADHINMSDHYVPTVDKIRLRFFIDVQKGEKIQGTITNYFYHLKIEYTFINNYV